MAQGRPAAAPTDPGQLQSQVALTTAALGAAYASMLAVLERRLPIKPGWVALEVIGGVMLVGLPVISAARTAASISWRDYERLVITGFVGAGVPICLWQALEYGLLRRA
jgi:drug/metabolite transporter (DMT)-like permease